MPKSVLDAIKLGQWDFEPDAVDGEQYSPTDAVPGSNEKLAILSERVRNGLPLWHHDDRRDYEEIGGHMRG